MATKAHNCVPAFAADQCTCATSDTHCSWVAFAAMHPDVIASPCCHPNVLLWTHHCSTGLSYAHQLGCGGCPMPLNGSLATQGHNNTTKCSCRSANPATRCLSMPNPCLRCVERLLTSNQSCNRMPFHRSPNLFALPWWLTLAARCLSLRSPACIALRSC